MMGSRVRVTQAAPVPQDNQDRVPTRFFAFFGSQTRSFHGRFEPFGWPWLPCGCKPDYTPLRRF
jgi:hypothetical protein